MTNGFWKATALSAVVILDLPAVQSSRALNGMVRHSQTSETSSPSQCN